ncbi:enhanced level of genomic instability 1 isoform X1 [Leptinotarsa decemlineata]|uniref:enhanced level of genomic instability 1 isoform X1 n=2 Tax=Leptinotarsa decemlineata TaxID=7539 RepID=UPI003D30665D
MKEITDYFSSPTKKVTANIEVSTTLEIPKKNAIVEHIEEAVVSHQSPCNDLPVVEEHPRKKSKRRKTDKHRKLSDPAVKTVTELFSTSCCLLSPNQQSAEGVNLIQTETEEEDVENVKLIGNISFKENQQNSDSEPFTLKDDKKSIKPNAFQFMMDSRNKSIGMNSPGKEIQEEKSEDIPKKDKLIARKNLLSMWADKKRASKRKRTEEEIDEIISYKLDKRAKRLQKLLKAEKVEKETKDSAEVFVKNRRYKTAKTSYSINDGTDNNFDNENVNLLCKNISELNKMTPNLNKGVGAGKKIENMPFVTIDNDKNPAQSRLTKTILKPKKVSSSKSEKSNFHIISSRNEVIGSEKFVETVNQTGSTTLTSKKNKRVLNLVDSSNKINEGHSSNVTIKIEEKKGMKSQKNGCTNLKLSNKEKKSKIPSDNSNQNCKISTLHKSQSWKMKIKVNLDENEKVSNEEESRQLRKRKNVNYRDGLPIDKISENEATERDTLIISSESEEDSNINKKTSKNSRIAPVFTKATPKPKEDPGVKEARRQFLMSGIPSSLKKLKEKQQSIEEQNSNIFPTISHVQQKCDSRFWNLPDPGLEIYASEPLKIDQSNILCKEITRSHLPQKINIKMEMEKIDKLKLLLNKIKTDNPNYPVYKSFRSIYEKSGKNLTDKIAKKTSPKKTKKIKKKKLNSSGKFDDASIIPSDSDSTIHSMWTEKYKPKCSDDIIGNSEAVKNLKKWLVIWMKYSEDINLKRRRTESSGSDFDTSDYDSRDSTALPGNTVVLGGPCGSGKSTAVYAICNELGFNIIELNASSKRTGKRLLLEIQEATQSHQVRKQKSQFFAEKKLKERIEDTESQTNKKMCVILIEDIDIVFEQDDGFISALTQLITTSKRPIVLTTTNYDSVFVQKFLNEYEYIPFLSLSSYSLSVWLQILCLIEGIFVHKNDIGNLLEVNKGDVRKTLLQLQFWVSSGGQISQNEIPIKIEEKRSSCEEKLDDDEEPDTFPTENTNEDIDPSIHYIGSFEIFHVDEPFSVPYYLNLGMLWWNIPNIFNLPQSSCQRIQKFQQCSYLEKTNPLTNKFKSNPEDKRKLNLASKLYDSLAFTDVMFRKVNYSDSIEPIVKNISCSISDSLELREDFRTFSGDADFVHEITHVLVDGHIKQFGEYPKLDMAVPNRAERRWRAKNHVCEDIFLEALSVSNHLERKSISLDYMPMLRNMFRTETIRASNNTKRGNRFRNYLKDLGVNCNANTVKLACNIMKETD